MITKSIKKEIMEYFFINPNKKYRVREIERELSLSLPSVIRYCKELVQEEILEKINLGAVVFYTANKANKLYLLEKKMFNLKQVYNSGILDYLRENLSNPVIILFGSYSKGEDIETSDIDLYIGTIAKKKINLIKFERFLNRKIQVFKFKDIMEIPNKHLANNIVNGCVLNSYLEVFK